MNNLNDHSHNSDQALEDHIEKLSQKINILLDAVINQAANGMMLLDQQGVILMANTRACDILSDTSIHGKKLTTLFAPDQAMELETGFNQVQLSSLAEGESAIDLELPYYHQPEKYKILSTTITSLHIDEESFFILSIKDLSREKRYEVEISLLAHAMMSISEGLTIIDLDGKIIFGNEAFYTIFDYPLNSLNGHDFTELCDEDSTRLFRQNALQLNEQQCWQGELKCVRREGDAFPYNLSTSTIKDEQGAPFLLICVGRDITEKKDLEVQLQQSQKMEAIGQLAGGVAHDFNNLLIVIRGHTDKLLQHLRDETLLHSVREINKAAKRASGLTRQLLAYSRKQILTPEVFDINILIQELYKMLSSLIGENIKFELELSPSPMFILADQHQISNVIMNLCVNARDAMSEGGHLTIQTSKIDYDGLKCTRGDMPKDEHTFVALTVRDTGCGMSGETISKIFDPFFTTKPKDRGTGLGLSMVYGIIKQSGGGIAVESTPGIGTTFHIYFPYKQKEDAMPQKTLSENPPEEIDHPENATVLVVEDEEQVRELVCEMLETYGYNVLYALNGLEAIDVYKKNREHIDLILTDVVMPEMGGKKLIESLPDLRKGVKVLYMSGYTDNAIDEQGILNPDTEFIQKPFSPVELLNKVGNILKNR
ncbi:MAG: PAS domain-containing sensor histidine kinase [Calditrichaeota bacterium]|nr:MAG: PAS domain-containing sensor histidine kinase [Calditrichota bacterium]